MALQSFGGSVLWPPTGINITTTPAFLTTQYTIDAAGESAAAIFRVPKTGTISAVTFRTATVTTGATVDVRLETVDLATGFPSGTLWAANTNGAQAIADANDNVVFTTTLTSGASVTQGDLIAMVIVTPSGAMQITGWNTQNAVDFPYGALFTASWASVAAVAPMAGMQYNDGSYAFIPNIPVISTLTQTSYGTGTNPNHRALRFQVTAPCRVCGYWVVGDLDGDCDVLLVADSWDGTNGNALARVSLDTNVRRVTGFGAQLGAFDTSVTLTANTTYRLVLKPTTATTISMSAYTVASAAQLDQCGGNQQCYLSTANNPNDATDWTDTTTTRPLMGLMIDQFDDGASAGSTVYNLAMQ